MPGDLLHWAFVALLVLALIVGAWVWWLDRDRTYTEDDLEVIEFADYLTALDEATGRAL